MPYPVQATIQPLRTFDSLPRHLKGNYLDGWFLDEESKEIDIDDLLGHADYTWPNDREYANKQTINGIIYQHPATY